ncbi:LysE family translocator [Yonghaparkia sp. Soil809]|uniref:LysE family translocator n=1 Tax=Yonghaparkia sp. Soil809 TaxID=1736417 RepID=UPI0006F42D39|nr:LysE family translocator [Yonghaparkia sp. Soil809]KRF30763.1 lysine transporter LysE [Yonghaparkia sp. Soil809]
MVFGPEFAAFLLTSIVIIVVPGPGVLFVIGRALALGTRAALLSVLGGALGVGLQIVSVALGVGVVIAQSELLFTILKIAGALVLVWLGVQSIRHRNEFGEQELDPVTPRTTTIVRESVVVGITNPKTIVFFVAALPQAVVPGGAEPAVQMLLLGAIFLVIGIVSDGLYGIAAGTAREWFASNRSRIAAVRAAGGVALIVLGIVMAFAARS